MSLSLTALLVLCCGSMVVMATITIGALLAVYRHETRHETRHTRTKPILHPIVPAVLGWVSNTSDNSPTIRRGRKACRIDR